MAKYGNLEGTLRTEFYIGKSNIIGFRTNAGIAEYRNFGGAWEPFNQAAIAVDTDFADDNTEDSYTGSAWVQKVRLTFTPLSAGYYEIVYSCLLASDDTNAHVSTQIQIDDDPSRIYHLSELPITHDYPLFIPRTGMFCQYLTYAEHTIDLDYHGEGGSRPPTMWIKEACLSIRRARVS